MNNRPVKVLVIDDNADNLITLKVLVKEHFPESIVFTAQRGKKGLQIAIDEDPDVILLDVVMPEMDGFEVCRKIKNDKKLSAIPVIFVTALKEDKETRAKAMSAGADAFLSKPVDETDLTVQIRAMVRIKDAVIQKLNENQRLAALVEEQTRELKNTNLATMNLLEDLKHEIKARREAEEEIKDRERRLQQIFDILPIGLWFADETGKLIMGNPAGVKIWGAEPTVGIEEYGVFKARRLPENVEIKGEDWALAKTVKDGVIIENELLEIDAFDGLKKVILNCTAPIMDDENKVKGAIVINQEVTEKYKYEEELKKSEEKYRLMAENMGNVITMLDMELNYTYGTPNIEKVLGFTVDEYIKIKVDQTMTPESFRIVMKAFEEEMAAEMSGTADPKRTRVLELEEYRKDGSTIWMENVISFVRDETGNPTGILTVSRDVTERRIALEEKAKLTQQLYHAQKMETVGTLAGGIAHDFNNLLQVIGGYTSMLLSIEGRDISEVNKLKTIEKAVDRASELVNNLLAFSRKNVSMKKEIDFNDEIIVSVKILERTLPKMVTIKTCFDGSIPRIMADSIHIEQIMFNLCKNASDAMPYGGTISIKTEYIKQSGGFLCKCNDFKKGDYILLTVADTGEGIDEKIIGNIFDPFFTTKEVGKGTGLGLASVYGIVESYGGHIHCESNLGKGTVFTVYFPTSVCKKTNDNKVLKENS